MDNRLFFENALRDELVRSEQKRLFITSLLIGIGVVDFLLINIFADDVFRGFFENRWSYIILYLWMVFFFIVEFIQYLLIRYKIKNGKISEVKVSRYTILGEITYLNLILLLMLILEKKPVTIDSPILFILFILLVISSLRLEFDYSFVAGIVAALEYLIIVIIAINLFRNDPEYGLKLPEVTYYYRSVFLLATGFTSGFVAREIKRSISRSLNSINEKRKIELLFGQQVEPEVVRTLINETMRSKQMDVTIMFFDVRDFTDLAESRTPDEIIYFQNNVLSPVIDIIHQHKGIVNQILGDGIMATFGAPKEFPDHAQYALNAAADIRERIGKMSESGEIPPINIGIGLHSGPVVTGNIGPESRKQFSISGKTVIIAARLEQLNKKFGSSILVSGETIRRIGPDKKYISCGIEHLKGLEKGIEVYRIE